MKTYGAVLLFCVATVCFALAIQHFWISRPGMPSTGMAGVQQAIIEPIRKIAEEKFDITEGESKLAYVKRITDMVHLSTYYCEPTDFRLSFLDRIFLRFSKVASPFAEGVLVKDRFTCGVCSQRAFLVYYFLSRNGFEPKVFGLSGHVVVRVEVGGRYYFTDADFGVGPFLADDDVQKLRASVRLNYAMAAQESVLKITEIYASKSDNEPQTRGIYDAYTEQKNIFGKSNVTAVVLMFVSLLGFLISAWIYMRRGRALR